MTRSLRARLAATLAVLLATGCGGVDAASGGTGGDVMSSTDAVAWVDDVCGALAGFTLSATAQPALDPTDPVGTVRSLGSYLGSTTTALDAAISGLQSVGASPVEGGDEYVTRLTESLTRIRTSFDTARTRLVGVDTSSAQSVAAALPAAVAPLQELGALPDPTQGLQGSAELQAAAAQAPNCRPLGTTG